MNNNIPYTYKLFTKRPKNNEELKKMLYLLKSYAITFKHGDYPTKVLDYVLKNISYFEMEQDEWEIYKSNFFFLWNEDKNGKVIDDEYVLKEFNYISSINGTCRVHVIPVIVNNKVFLKIGKMVNLLKIDKFDKVIDDFLTKYKKER